MGTVMISYNTWNGVRAHASRRLMTDILKGELGFRGFLISDWAAIDAIPGDYRSDVETSINAGLDMVMVPDKYPEFYNTLKSLVEEGNIPMARIDDAVRRILRVKAAMGLLDEGANVMADRRLHASFRVPEHRAPSRASCRQSLVLLKNEGKALPLSKAARIHVAGRNADDIGNQCGGWTIDWQGKSGPVMTGGTTILQAIRAVSPAAKVTFSADGSGAEGAPTSRSRWSGRSPMRRGSETTPSRCCRTPTPANDRPRSRRSRSRAGAGDGRARHRAATDPGDRWADADAVVAAWLPGTEGAGVADVLFGDYKPTGNGLLASILVASRSMAQLPINVGDAKYDPLFPFGFGLTY